MNPGQRRTVDDEMLTGHGDPRARRRFGSNRWSRDRQIAWASVTIPIVVAPPRVHPCGGRGASIQGADASTSSSSQTV
jgi:hypothetical protein